jgi:hypothetical protein
MSSKITLEKLSEFFQLPQKDAAREMEMSLTSLKKICRAHGITRWPFRKLMSLERTIDKMNRDSSIIESISAQHVTVSKLGGLPLSGDSQDPSRSLKVEVNPKHLLTSGRPIVAIHVSREDSPDLKDPSKHMNCSPDRSMPPPPPRMPPSVMQCSDPREMHVHSQWITDKQFSQHLLPIPSGINGVAAMQSSSGRPTGKPMGDSSPPPGISICGDQHGYTHSASHRPLQPACDAGAGDPTVGGGGGGARAAPEVAADALPSCSICPHRMNDILLYSWSNIWSLHNLR